MTRRAVRLLMLLGVAVGVYLVLSLFEHAARADTGSTDQGGVTDPIASAKILAAGAGTAVKETKPVTPKSITSKAHPPEIQRSTVKAAEIHLPKVQAPKVQAPKVQAPKVRAPKIGQSTSDSVRDVARATVTPAGKAVVRLKLPAHPQLPARPELAKLPRLPRAEISALPHLPPTHSSWPDLPTWPQLSSWPQLPSWPQTQIPPLLRLPGLHQVPMLVLTQPSASANAPALHQPLMPPVSAQLYPLPQAPAFGPAAGPAGVIKPPTAQTRPPLPAAPRQPTDFSTTTGQASDSGGGSAPSTGTVSSSWRPEVTAAGCRLATDVITRGRTVRYAGPPS